MSKRGKIFIMQRNKSYFMNLIGNNSLEKEIGDLQIKLTSGVAINFTSKSFKKELIGNVFKMLRLLPDP